jgi:hypothetical protein
MATWERAGPPSPIYVSIMVGGNGSENRTAVAAAEAVGKLADEVSANFKPDGLQVDLTFHVAGAIVSPEYQGVRTGRYLAKEQLLVVQAAVPVPLSAFAARDYIVNVLDETLRLVKAFVARRKLKVSTTTIESVLTEMLHRASELRIQQS